MKWSVEIMVRGLKKHLEEFAERRVEELSILKSKNDNDYEELRKRAYEAQHKLAMQLSDKQQDLFVEYEAAINAQDAIMMESLYKEGLFDGVKIAKMILRCSPKDIDNYWRDGKK